MTTAPPRPTRRAPIPAHTRPAEEGRDPRHDPARLAAALRDLAARAHRAVRALDRRDPATPAVDALRELAELHPRIVEIQRALDGASQRDLDSYLSALRREVESRLG